MKCLNGNSNVVNYIFTSAKINRKDQIDAVRNKSLSQLIIKNDRIFFKHLLLLSGDIEVHPGPIQFLPNVQKDMHNIRDKNILDKFRVLEKHGIHFIHVNIKSILPKIEEIRLITHSVNLSVIGISDSKLSSSVNDNEIKTPGYDILRKDRNRNGGGVLAYIRNDISYNVREDLNSRNETIFFEIFLQNSKPILIGIFYRPPNDSQFFKVFQSTLDNAKDFNEQETYIMGDMNINMDISNSNNVALINEYNVFCKIHGVLQTIKSHTHVSKMSSSIN